MLLYHGCYILVKNEQIYHDLYCAGAHNILLFIAVLQIKRESLICQMVLDENIEMMIIQKEYTVAIVCE